MMTLARLTWMDAPEFEQIREAGYDFRRELTHAVMALITVPEKWDQNGEYRSEFGGYFPVQIRFTPEHGRFHIALCSPGEVCEQWLMVIFSADGRSVTCVRKCPRFDRHVFSHVLSLVASLEQEGYNLCHIIQTLKDNGGTYL